MFTICDGCKNLRCCDGCKNLRGDCCYLLDKPQISVCLNVSYVLAVCNCYNFTFTFNQEEAEEVSKKLITQYNEHQKNPNSIRDTFRSIIKQVKNKDKENCESCSNKILRVCYLYNKQGIGLNLPLKNVIKPCNHYNKPFDLSFEQSSKVKEKCEKNDQNKSLEEIVNDVKLQSKEKLIKEISKMCGLSEEMFANYTLQNLTDYKNALIKQKEALDTNRLILTPKEDKLYCDIYEWQKEESTKEKIERLEKSIQEVKDKRKKILENLYNQIEKKILNGEVLEDGFVNYVISTENNLANKLILSRKSRRKLKKSIKKLNFILNHFLVEKSPSRYKRFFYDDITEIYRDLTEDLHQDEWDKLLKLLHLILKYQLPYLEIKEKKELCRLTKCWDELDSSNSCKYTCEKCGKVNATDANYCAECGSKL